ncbi:MAG: hypothetical protein GY859_30040 [Desulfobacterales bacterium]|nr:hypothetical protein [Desulfobacterales bacterium]
MQSYPTHRIACFYLIGVALLAILTTAPFVFADSKKSDDEAFAEFKPMAEKSLLLDIAWAGDARLVAVGERGHVLLSDDKGGQWRQAKVPTRATLTAVFFVDDKHGWTVGHDSIILSTQDGGENWKRLFFAPDLEQPLLDVLFTDLKHGVAVGAYGLYLETMDGGESWEERYFEPLDDPDFGLPHINALALFPGGSIYMAGEAGLLARSPDLGKTWEKLDKPYGGSYFTLLITRDDALIAAGLRGNIYRSADRGETWVKAPSGVQVTLNQCIQAPSGVITIVGLSGVILTSKDDGRTFQPVPNKDRKSIAAAAVPDARTLVLVGQGGAWRFRSSEL